MNQVLVLNSGSSSIKYQLIDMDDRARLAVGAIERIGESSGAVADHAAGMKVVLAELEGALDRSQLAAVGHRVVHGGDRFRGPTLIDDEVCDAVRELIPLAPLHNPANLTLIEAARAAFPDTPQVAVFDTAFHQTLPAAAHTYAVPQSWRTDLGVRRYGFHGTSHQYVSRRAAAMLGRRPEEVNVIVLHLGNGASVCAIREGKSIDTSMGMTPLEGLIMGTRSGDLDPAIPAYIARQTGRSPEQIDQTLNKESGLLALAGSNDLRDVDTAAATGDEAAQLALDAYCYRIRKYIGAYLAALGRLDALVFTAGVGENSPTIRAGAVAGLDHLGIAVSPKRNTQQSKEERYISPYWAETAVLVVPTDEEIEIADQALAVLGGAS
ncbi:acetate kinase [Catenulispora acidiphila DSM 44928]|uniref:Acetate kinase n=1 Tax=Catenulispora acidiphila (strain DSM 44928 / JCM 14897 / NBRC 102108 / NRRL B-24433 / ID139908) TaxID=479433 RepID=C7QIH3_CATAD|nr:acetate kinase [Catenulispora acidiphila]ACU75050.1 acetate kinase [Catenulispora acidiphila DSM 44928]